MYGLASLLLNLVKNYKKSNTAKMVWPEIKIGAQGLAEKVLVLVVRSSNKG